MRRCCLFLLALLSLVSVPVSAEQTFKLQTIRVIGSNRFREDDLIAALGLKLGTQVDVDALKKAADNLMQTGALATFEYRYTPLSTGLLVEYTVTDATEFLPCRYDNIVWLDGAQLTKEVHEIVPLYNGEAPTSGTLLDQIADAISTVLAKHGVVTKIKYDLHSGGVQGPVDAILFLSDTVKPKAQEIVLTGATQLTPEEKTENTKRLVGEEYLSSRFHDSLSRELAFVYGNRGYLKLQVGDPQAAFIGDPQAGSLRITVPVTEGEQYRLQSVSWTGNNAIPAPALDHLLLLHHGDVADASKLKVSLEEVATLYHTSGYVTVKAQTVPTFSDSDRSVAYEIKVTEGDLYHMGNLNLQGLDPGILQKLQKNWKMSAGDVYNGEYVQNFLKQNTVLINAGGRPKTVKILQTPRSGNIVDVSITF